MSKEKELVKTENSELRKFDAFKSVGDFAQVYRMSEALAKSTIIPKDYYNNPANIVIAIDVANRLNANPLMVMQNLYIVNGRPAWSSQFLSATINASKKFKTNIQYEMINEGKPDMKCRAYVLDNDENRLDGPWLTMEMAEKEGWINKSGSKWKTMPEVMIRYRAVSFFARLHCSDLTMGFYTAEEAIELNPEDYIIVSQEEAVSKEVEENANKEEIDIEEAPAEENEEIVEKENEKDNAASVNEKDPQEEKPAF